MTLVPSPRNTGLDRARAVAVVAMVMGHTLDAVLSDAVRNRAGVQAYWSLRAVTAPLFLFVAGWAFSLTVQRTGAQGRAVLRRYLPRVGLLLGWGYLLRWPGWGLPALYAGDLKVWQHFLAFDALHGVGAALLVGAGVLAVLRGRAARMAALATLVVLVPLVSPWVREAVGGGAWPLVLEQALAGRTSAFPLFPWLAYFLAGCFTGLGLGLLERVPAWMGLMGAGTAVLVLMTLWGGKPTVSDATLVAWRLGLLLVVAGVAMLLPSRMDPWMGPVGRASLWVYIVHIPIAYGWSSFPGLAYRMGRSQELLPALGLAVGVLVVSLGLALPAKRLYGSWRVRGRDGEVSLAPLPLPAVAAAPLAPEPPTSSCGATPSLPGAAPSPRP